MNGLSSGTEWRYALTRKAMPQTTSATPRIAFAVSSYPSPYSFLSHHETATPRSENGAEPSSIHAVRRACTCPMRRCWAAPNDLKIAPWTMSVPIAIDGLKPNSSTSSGVISEPPPMPVIPTSRPTRSPARESFQSMSAPVAERPATRRGQDRPPGRCRRRAGSPSACRRAGRGAASRAGSPRPAGCCRG